MAYTRFTDGDGVYVYETTDAIVCQDCNLDDAFNTLWLRRRTLMLEHLKQHRYSGYVVRQEVFDKISQKIAEEGDHLIPPDEMYTLGCYHSVDTGGSWEVRSWEGQFLVYDMILDHQVGPWFATEDEANSYAIDLMHGWGSHGS